MTTINVSDTRAHVYFGVTKVPSISIASPFRNDDPDIIFSDEQEAFQDFNFVPFTIHQKSDDDIALMT